MNRNKELYQYCKKQMTKNQSLLAQVLDYILLYSLFLIISYFWFMNQTHHQGITIVLSMLVTILLGIALHLWRKIRLTDIMEKSKKEFARKYIIEQLVHMDYERFLSTLYDTFKKLCTFEELQITNDRITGLIDGCKFIIKGIQNHPEVEVSREEVLSFYRELNAHEYPLGFLAATSPFSAAAISYIEKIKRIKIHLIDQKALLTFMEEADQMPAEESITQYMLDEIAIQQKNWNKIRKEALLPKKAKSYAIYGVVLLATSYITRFTSYYMILSVICFGLSFITFYQSHKREKGEPSFSSFITSKIK